MPTATASPSCTSCGAGWGGDRTPRRACCSAPPSPRGSRRCSRAPSATPTAPTRSSPSPPDRVPSSGHLRVVAGRYGGRRLRSPPGRATRPTADRVREALFALLADVARLSVLDLFAGSGALGIEALSRGAATVTFVDSAAAAVR